MPAGATTPDILLSIAIAVTWRLDHRDHGHVRKKTFSVFN
jgi:hypothetical protein